MHIMLFYARLTRPGAGKSVSFECVVLLSAYEKENNLVYQERATIRKPVHKSLLWETRQSVSLPYIQTVTQMSGMQRSCNHYSLKCL